MNNNGHPRLVWRGNTEPDMNYYTIYRDLNNGLGYLSIATTNELFYDDQDDIQVTFGKGLI